MMKTATTVVLAFVLFAQVLFPLAAWAGSLVFSKTVNLPKLYYELKQATGLHFELESSTSTQEGWVKTEPEGYLQVGVYEVLYPSVPHISSASWTQALQDDITTVVNNHTP